MKVREEPRLEHPVGDDHPERDAPGDRRGPREEVGAERHQPGFLALATAFFRVDDHQDAGGLLSRGALHVELDPEMPTGIVRLGDAVAVPGADDPIGIDREPPLAAQVLQDPSSEDGSGFHFAVAFHDGDQSLRAHGRSSRMSPSKTSGESLGHRALMRRRSPAEVMGSMLSRVPSESA